MGVAYPIRATITGEGVGACRHCIFTTGTFVEPITHWEAPTRLSFDVTSQPDPMTELSPYKSIHPPHLDSSFRSLKGEFRLRALGNDSTLLEGVLGIDSTSVREVIGRYGPMKLSIGSTYEFLNT